MAESKAVFTPLLYIANLVSLMVLKQIALAEEVIAPVLVAAHFTDLRKQAESSYMVQLQL